VINSNHSATYYEPLSGFLLLPLSQAQPFSLAPCPCLPSHSVLSLSVNNKVSHPYKTTDKVQFLHFDLYAGGECEIHAKSQGQTSFPLAAEPECQFRNWRPGHRSEDNIKRELKRNSLSICELDSTYFEAFHSVHSCSQSLFRSLHHYGPKRS